MTDIFSTKEGEALEGSGVGGGEVGGGGGGGGALRTVGGDSGIARPSFSGSSVDILGSTFDSSRVVVGEGDVDDDDELVDPNNLSLVARLWNQQLAVALAMESQLVRRFLPGFPGFY